MINMSEIFRSYMGTNATLEHFRCVANALLGGFLSPIGLFFPPGVVADMPWKAKDSGGKLYYGFYILKKHWVTTDIDISNCSDNDKNYFIHLEFRWHDGDDDVKLCIHYEPYPYRPTKTEDLPIPFRRLQERFSDELHSRLPSSWKRSDYKWQKAICTISADRTINEVKAWFEEQSRIGERIIDETIERVLA